MKRLTERDEFGNADIIGVDSEDLQINLNSEEFNKVTVALNKLADYEDMQEKITKRIQELKSSSNYPHFYKGQMVEDFEWVLNLLN